MALFLGFFTFLFTFLFTLTKNLSLVVVNLVKAIVVSAVKLVIVPVFKAFTDAFCKAGKNTAHIANEMLLSEIEDSFHDSVKELSIGEWIAACAMDFMFFVLTTFLGSLMIMFFVGPILSIFGVI